MRSIKLPTVSQALAGLAIFVFLSFPAALVGNAVTGWFDEQIAVYFGWTSPTVAQVVLFTWHWIVPFIAAVAVLIAYHFWYTLTEAGPEKARVDAIQRINVDPIIAGSIFLVVVGLIIFAVRTSALTALKPLSGGFFLTGDPPPILPDLLSNDGGPIKWYRGYLFGASGNDKGVFFSTFQATGQNDSDEFLGPISGYVRSEITGRQFALLSADGQEVPIDGKGVPARNQFHIFARLTDTPLLPNDFLRDFSRLTFVFQYGNHVYTKRFSPDEIETEVRRAERDLAPKPPHSVVGLQPMPSASK